MSLRVCREGTSKVTVDHRGTRNHTQLVLRGYNPYRNRIGVSYGPHVEFQNGAKRFLNRRSDQHYSFVNTSPLRLFINGASVIHGYSVGIHGYSVGLETTSLSSSVSKYLGVHERVINWNEIVITVEGLYVP